MGNVTQRREIPLRSVAAALLALALCPVTGNALTQPTLRDLADPVAPGGLLPYRIVLNRASGASVPATPTCFNPPAECLSLPVICTNKPPTCVGNPIAGFVCQTSGNDGANCGVGTPPTPDNNLCIPRPVPAGVCNGGPNFGLACNAPDGTLTTECPGSTFLCKRAYNEGAYCGLNRVIPVQCLGDEETGFFCSDSVNDGAPCGTEEADEGLCIPLIPEPRPEESFCLDNPTGICNSGTNFGLPCTVPHGETTPECPASTGPAPTPTNITVTLPLLAGMEFRSADNGGTSNGTEITWTVPPLTSCGVPGTPACPNLNATVAINPLVAEGTVYQNTATATDQDGFLVSAPHTTLVARARLRALTLVYPGAFDRDRFTYRVLFALTETENIDPDTEEFRLNVANSEGTIYEAVLAPGLLLQSNTNTWTYTTRAPGLKGVRLRQMSAGSYALRVRAAQLDLPSFTDLNVTVTLTIGDVTITHPARLVVKRGGKRYVSARSTSSTVIVAPPTTTTSTTVATTTSSSTTLDTTTTSTTLDTTTTSTTLDTTTTSTTLDTTTTSTTLDTTTTSTTLDTTTTSTTLDTTTTSTTLDTTTTTETSTSSSTTETSTSSSTTETSTSSSTTETSTSSSTTETSTSSSTTETSTSSSTTETSTSSSTTETSTSSSTTETSTSSSTTETSTSSSTTETSTTTSTTLP